MSDKCGCGKRLRYSHFKEDRTEVMSCNKYVVCMTYDEQRNKLETINAEMLRYKTALTKIVETSGMFYEFKSWAKDALDHAS